MIIKRTMFSFSSPSLFLGGCSKLISSLGFERNNPRQCSTIEKENVEDLKAISMAPQKGSFAFGVHRKHNAAEKSKTEIFANFKCMDSIILLFELFN